MKLGINILFLEPGKVGGSETYTREMLESVDRNLALENDVILYCTKSFSDTVNFSRIKKRICIGKHSSKIFRLFYEIFVLPFILFYNGVDILLSLGYTSPIFTHCKKIATIYDLQFRSVPYTVSFVTKTIYNLLIPLVLRFNNQIITTSYFSKNEIQKYYKIADGKIRVIYGGIKKQNQKYLPYAKKENYIMTSAASHPHKNLDSLIDAFNLIIKDDKYNSLKLYITGFPSLAHNKIQNKIKGLKLGKKIIYLGWVGREKYYHYLRGAKAFAFISSYEGFGFPPLEAMSVGTPVIASRCGSLGEVLGDGALIVDDPRNWNDVSEKIKSVLENRTLYDNLVQKGIRRSEKFSWDTSYKEMENMIYNLSSLKNENL
jgi:glycosyltransferase involved in cell wall biosynthesis